MGKQQKTKSFSLKEKPQEHARNLRRDKLGAVIFGCKNHTIAECLQDKIFGLPAFHYSYVKNIQPGLPLFLFNYTDRTLHGIYEAATCGEMSINKYAWTSTEGTECTSYPAQVRINVLMPCRPLREEEFKPVIAGNYYAERLFWFELDRAQTGKLASLFLSSIVPENPQNAISGVPRSSLQRANVDSRQYDGKIENHEYRNASVLVESSTHAPEKKWTELFKGSAMEIAEGSDLDRKLSSSSSEVVEYLPEACTEFANLAITHKSEELVGMDGNSEYQCAPKKKWSELLKASSDASAIENAKGSDLEQRLASSSHEVSVQLPGASTEAVDSHIRDSWEELADTDSDEGVNYEMVHEPEYRKDSFLQDATSSDDRTSESLVAVKAAEAVLDGEEESDSRMFESVIFKLRQEIEGLKVYQFKQSLKVDSLEHELTDTKMELYQLKKRCKQLSSGVFCSAGYSDEDVMVSPFTSAESVLVVGGYNGNSWIEDIQSYAPSEDKVKSLCSMTFPRSYAALSNLNNELYLIGGFHDAVWYDTVESYNPLTNRWVQRPSLNRKKGSVAGTCIHGKIYAIGGGNGGECFAEVELFDINVARWMSTRSMLEKRFAPAAVEMNGALYVAGGYDGRNYLSSAERFDPREGSWGVLFGMESRRAGHSMVVYKEKLYALGGFDGASMLPSVEVFDPRLGLWVTVEPMAASRGYFGALPIDGRICVIGGFDANDVVLDVVEYYEEGSGWQRPAKSSALGKRCFFASLLL